MTDDEWIAGVRASIIRIANRVDEISDEELLGVFVAALDAVGAQIVPKVATEAMKIAAALVPENAVGRWTLIIENACAAAPKVTP